MSIRDVNPWNALGWLCNVVVVVLLGVGAWGLKELLHVEGRVTVMESATVTSRDVNVITEKLSAQQSETRSMIMQGLGEVKLVVAAIPVQDILRRLDRLERLQEIRESKPQ